MTQAEGNTGWHSSWHDTATGDIVRGHQESFPPQDMTQHKITGFSFPKFFQERCEYPTMHLHCISGCSKAQQPLWVTFNYCRPFGDVFTFSSLDDSTLISIWNYTISSLGSWLRLDVFLFCFFSHFPNFSSLAEPRGGPGEKFKELLEPCEHFKLHKFGWRGFF